MTIPLVIILNLVLSVTVVSGILGLLGWSIATRGRDITSARRYEFAVGRDPSSHQLWTPDAVGTGNG